MQHRLDNLISVQTMWTDDMPDAADFVRACRDTAERLIKGEIKEAEARRYLSALAAKPSRRAS